MRPRTITALAAVVLASAAPVALASQPTTLGTGAKTCVLKPGASCKAVVHHRASLAGRDLRGARFYGARMHHADFRGANLRGAHFHRAVIHHADFRGADLRGARFHGTKLRGADLSGAKLKGAHFGPPRARKGSHQAQPAPSCNPNCAGADLTLADFHLANLEFAYLISADATGTKWDKTTCPNGYVTPAWKPDRVPEPSTVCKMPG